jgi:hypothetical protein
MQFKPKTGWQIVKDWGISPTKPVERVAPPNVPVRPGEALPPGAEAPERGGPPNAPTAPTGPVLPDGAGRPPNAPVSASLTWAGLPNKGETKVVACSEDAGDGVTNEKVEDDGPTLATM